MDNRRRARILLAVLVLAALVLVTVDFRSDGSAGDGPLGALRGVASAVFGPIQSGLATIVSPIGNALSGIGGLFDARAENQQLQSQLNRLQERRLSYDDVLRENEQFRTLLGIQQRSSLDTAAAQVISNGPSNFEWTVTLDVGTDAGVARDMPVINGDGLVGRIIQTTADTSRVLLAIDPSFEAASAHAETGQQGTVRGDGNDPMVFRPTDPEIEVNVGDEIVTSRYSNGVFPAGIPIGTVADTAAGQGLLTRAIPVRPWVNFTSLQTVLVVLYQPQLELPGNDLGGGLDFRAPDVSPTLPKPSVSADPFNPFTSPQPSGGLGPSPSEATPSVDSPSETP